MSAAPAPARIFGFVAAKADVCVLLRRGPSKWVLMVRWDLRTDEFEIGQWLKARVYERESDLSPDGRLFAYQALDGKWQSDSRGVYTAISRPPYFTALAFWDQGTTYDRGFRWSRSAWWLPGYRPQAPAKGTLPRRYARDLASADWISAAEGRGWKLIGFAGDDTILDKLCFAGELRWSAPRFGTANRYLLNHRPLDATWADVDHRGRLLLAREGRVFVHDGDGEREVIDLNPFQFRPLEPPPWATRWPGAEAEGG